MGWDREVCRTGAAWMVAAVLAACGGGGGGGGGDTGPSVNGNGLAPASGPGDTQRYFPTTVGNRWSYDSGGLDVAAAATGRTTATLTGTRTLFGETAYVVEQIDAATGLRLQQFFGVRPGGISRLGDDDAPDPITPLLLPYTELLFPVVPGPVSTITAARLPMGEDADGNPLTMDLRQTIVNAGFETVVVAAGSFTNALRQVTQIDGHVDDAALQLSLPFSGTDTRWLVPGVGIVRQTTSTTVDGETVSVASELRGYSVDGVTRGLGDPVDVVGGLSPADGFLPKPDADPALAGDGSRHLVLARRISGSAPPYQAQWTATLLSADGVALAGTPLTDTDTVDDSDRTRRAALAFGGAAYLAVVPRDNHFAVSGLAPSLVAVRVAADGTRLGDAQPVAGPGAIAPALAFDGSRFLLVYTRSVGNGDSGRIWGVFLGAATGTPEGSEFALSAADGQASSPAVAAAGGRFLVAWNQYGDTQRSAGVVALRVGDDGSLPDGAGIAVRRTGGCCVDHRPAVRHDGTQWLLAWRDFARQHDNLHTNIVLARLGDDGSLRDSATDPPGIAVTTADGLMEGGPLLAPLPGGEMLIAWALTPPTHALWDLRGARYGAGGLVVSSPLGTPLLQRANLLAPVLDADAGGALLVWLRPSAAGSAAALGGLRVHPFGGP